MHCYIPAQGNLIEIHAFFLLKMNIKPDVEFEVILQMSSRPAKRLHSEKDCLNRTKHNTTKQNPFVVMS